jgi:GNAT superfamily N-acetyltransferase
MAPRRTATDDKRESDALGIESVDVLVDNDDAELIDLLAGVGFVVGEEDGTAWMDAEGRPDVTPLPEGFVLVDRALATTGPDPMRRRNGEQVEARLRQCSLYDPALDLAAETADGQVGGYALSWFDPVTRVGMLEPMRPPLRAFPLRQDVAVTDAAMAVRIVPANEASWDDLEAVLGGAGCHGGRCYCQRFKLGRNAWPGDDLERSHMLREQTDCGHPRSGTTSGLVAYVDGEPAGWCAVEPRSAYPYLGSVPWRKRSEDRTDAGIWAVPCFVTRSGFRRRGVSYALASAAVSFARARGARALEGYPMIPERGKDIPWGELHVGHGSIFAAAGFAEVTRPTLRRAVMRIDF